MKAFLRQIVAGKTAGLLGLISLLMGMGVLASADATGSMDSPPAPITSAPASVSTTEFPDIDGLASRMNADQDIYQKIRDEALGQYAKRNPNPSPYDDKAKTVVRLFALLCVWGDVYGENLWQDGLDYATSAQAQGANDPLLLAFRNVRATMFRAASPENDPHQVNRITDQFLSIDAPASLKLIACAAALDNLSNYSSGIPNSPVEGDRAHFVERWGQNYRELIKQGWPHARLFFTGDSALESVHNDEATLYLLSAEIDRDFNEVDPKNPVRTELDGDFYIKDAWSARGGDYANTVSDANWKLFADRLDQADKILESLYDQYPNELGICHAMMNVELGQGKGRDRLETWFQRAIKISPDDYGAYKSKEWYLLPRWYGKLDDIVSFGKECVLGGNWSAKIPMILPIGVAEAANGSVSPYQDPEIWPLLEKTYRDYLSHYPKAVFYRTSFAKHAFDGGHPDVALEQFNIMGDAWDHQVISPATHAEILSKLNAK